MLVGEHDFTERLCRRYDLWLGSNAPTYEEWPRIENADILEGYGTVGATRDVIEQFWRWLATS